MKTFRMFTEDYMDSYALHRTSTGPGINAYVPTADLNLRAQKKIKGGKGNSMKEKTNLQTNFGAIFLSLVKGKPVQLNLKQYLDYFLEFV